VAQHQTASKWLFSIRTSTFYFILISLPFIQKSQTVSKSLSNKNLQFKCFNLQIARFDPFGPEAMSQISNPVGSKPWLFIKIPWEAIKNASTPAQSLEINVIGAGP
jgi:hypothetical protein